MSIFDIKTLQIASISFLIKWGSMVGKSWEITGYLVGLCKILSQFFGLIFPTILPLTDHLFPTTFPKNSGEHQKL